MQIKKTWKWWMVKNIEERETEKRGDQEVKLFEEQRENRDMDKINN